MHEHRGHWHVDSKQGQGTLMKVTFDVANKAQPH
ncbi:hypothetical protein EXU30_06725 [Shewanella maritima]|uniref:Uncharacterized protein n=1 Tax=Shewanella maritima TaxID=2520507 RepID=A0A411PMQ9_9GAMM|nr:hypothetical protein EXU30_06725 [Shewanella maritima]